jgi:hypothetical protein
MPCAATPQAGSLFRHICAPGTLAKMNRPDVRPIAGNCRVPTLVVYSSFASTIPSQVFEGKRSCTPGLGQDTRALPSGFVGCSFRWSQKMCRPVSPLGLAGLGQLRATGNAFPNTGSFKARPHAPMATPPVRKPVVCPIFGEFLQRHRTSGHPPGCICAIASRILGKKLPAPDPIAQT